MYISKLTITNFRGIKDTRTINLARFSSVVGKNDAGKTIILNAIATFLDVKNFSFTQTDFNDISKPIEFEFQLSSDSIAELLETKVKSKVKKPEGLEEFISDLIFDNSIVYKRVTYNIGKSWSEEFILINDFENPKIQRLYFKSDEEISAILEEYKIEIPVEGKGRNSKAEKIKYIKEYFKDESKANFWLADDMKVSSLFPEVEMFKSDYGLEADTKFKTAT